ncbi:MAG: response regulator transcription factor [Micropruina sp.]
MRRHRPDVVLMDIRMPRMDGITATRAIVDDPTLAGVRVVVLTTFDEDADVLAAIRAGSAGYLLKDIAPDDLRAAIRLVAAGDALLSPAITGKVMAQLAPSHGEYRPGILESLTEREREVLTRVGLGTPTTRSARTCGSAPPARTYVRQPDCWPSSPRGTVRNW